MGSDLDTLLNTLISPLGAVAGVLFLLLLVATIALEKVKWGVLGLALYTGSLGVSDYLEPYPLAFPLQQLRAYGRPLTAACLLSLLAPAVLAPARQRATLAFGVAVAFFLYQTLFGLRMVLGGLAARGAALTLVFALLFVALGIGMPRWLRREGEVHAPLHALGLAALLFVLGTLYQFVVDPSAIVWSGRLFATTANAQHAAALMATAIPPVTFLAVCPAQPRWWRLVMAATLVGLLVLLPFTGSRTGILMTLVGVSLLFRRHFLLLLGMGLAFAFVLVALFTLSPDAFPVERLGSSEDTRSGDWDVLLQEAEQNIFFGTIREEAEVGVSSYLTVLARTGLFGVSVFAVIVVLLGAALLALGDLRPRLGNHTLLADLITGGIAALGLGAIFEGYLLGPFTFQVYALYFYLAVLGELLGAAPPQQFQPPR